MSTSSSRAPAQPSLTACPPVVAPGGAPGSDPAPDRTTDPDATTDADPAGGSDTAADPSATSRRQKDTRTYLRGSSLLLSGRAISLGLNFLVQVLTVRYLSKSDFGAFAYALGIATLGSTVLLFGFNRTIGRFIPIYQERGEDDKALGTLVVAAGSILGLGIACILCLIALESVLDGTYVKDPRALALLLILIVLAPIEAFDKLFQSAAAIFIGARAVFYRRHVLAPGLKLAAVLLVIAVSGDARLLAVGYVVGGALGVGVYVTILVRAWRDQGVLRHLRPRALKLPVREIIAFSAPLVFSEMLVALPRMLAVVILEYSHSTSAVAEYRAVLPIAHLNSVVLSSFGTLYVPLAARLFAREDREGLNGLYWQTATWISVLTFPVFVVTFGLAKPITVLLFGPTYASSAPLLAIMAIGTYFNAAMGFNVFTLRVQGNIRVNVAVNVATAVLGLGALLVLTVRYGALGAAIGTTVLLVLHNVLTHVGLVVVKMGIRLVDWTFLRTYLVILGVASGMLVFQQLFDPPLLVGAVLAVATCAVVPYLCRSTLRASEAFPELMRVPILRRLIA